MKNYKEKRPILLLKRLIIICALIAMGYLLSAFYAQNELNAQTCVTIGGHSNCTFFGNISGASTNQCGPGRYVGSIGFNTGDDMDDDDLWIWCCDYFN